MHRSSFILGSIGVFIPHYLIGKNKSPSEWWDKAIDSQKAFAKQCIEYGNTLSHLTSWTNKPGHTLAGISWMESSLGRDTNHVERSSGAFGISDYNRQVYSIPRSRRKGSRIYNKNSDKRNTRIVKNDFRGDAQIAIQIFEDNYRYFIRLGYSKKKSWFLAAARYNGGNNPNRKYAEKFNARVRFLNKQFKE